MLFSDKAAEIAAAALNVYSIAQERKQWMSIDRA